MNSGSARHGLLSHRRADQARCWRMQRGLVPRELRLEQNYPNPFNPSTTIQFSNPATQMVTVRTDDCWVVKWRRLSTKHLRPAPIARNGRRWQSQRHVFLHGPRGKCIRDTADDSDEIRTFVLPLLPLLEADLCAWSWRWVLFSSKQEVLHKEGGQMAARCTVPVGRTAERVWTAAEEDTRARVRGSVGARV